MMNEAMGIVADGIASPADVDIAMQLGAGMKSGPLHTADLVGHDVNLAIMETLYRETGDPKYRPHPLLRRWFVPASSAARPASASTTTESRILYGINAVSQALEVCLREFPPGFVPAGGFLLFLERL